MRTTIRNIALSITALVLVAGCGGVPKAKYTTAVNRADTAEARANKAEQDLATAKTALTAKEGEVADFQKKINLLETIVRDLKKAAVVKPVHKTRKSHRWARILGTFEKDVPRKCFKAKSRVVFFPGMISRDPDMKTPEGHQSRRALKKAMKPVMEKAASEAAACFIKGKGLRGMATRAKFGVTFMVNKAGKVTNIQVAHPFMVLANGKNCVFQALRKARFDKGAPVFATYWVHMATSKDVTSDKCAVKKPVKKMHKGKKHVKKVRKVRKVRKGKKPVKKHVKKAKKAKK